ncbi:choline kinase family protein [Eikenella corrodens]|uniref:choline kinase family protein n=1 Tax=Eikenella corrodens TaxID=539 RepID=UPI0007D08E5E|nr:choline kinase family protein [Eikenella corrodens]OAM31701.1 hypothetical protein A7P93_04500 [Eikenella corrodens]
MKINQFIALLSERAPQDLISALIEYHIIFSSIGGMTNQNYLVTIDNIQYVLRIPNKINSLLINRNYEEYNSKLASDIGVNVNTLYFNSKTGVKLTEYLHESRVLKKTDILDDFIVKEISKTFLNLHNAGCKFINRFNVLSEFNYYISLLKDKKRLLKYHSSIGELINFLFKLNDRYFSHENKISPCHNDLVLENILLKKERIFLIDWEYSGMNNPIFDIAAFLLEAELDTEESCYFLEHYYGDVFPIYKEDILNKIRSYQFSQDLLWFVWTLIKEEHNEYFGDYAKCRLERSIRIMREIKL